MSVDKNPVPRRLRPEVEVLEGRIVPSFAAPLSFPSGAAPQAIVAADFNGDHRIDLAVANRDDKTVSVFLNQGAGNFALQEKLTTSGRPWALAVGDLNGDGIPDLIVANQDKGTVSVFLGRGDGTFSPPTDFAAGSTPVSLAVADLTGHGRLDVIVADQVGGTVVGGTVNVLAGRGDGTLQSPRVVAIIPLPIFVTAADLNHDGKQDLVAISEGDINGTGASIAVLLGHGDGTFGPLQEYVAGAFPDAVAVGDFNGDGSVDLAVANFTSSSVTVLLGRGNGTFKPGGEFSTGRNPHDVAVGDFEGHGRLDLVTANFNGADISLLRGNGDGTFQAPRSIPAGVGPRTLVTADFNNDGRLDIAVAAQSGNTAVVLLNQPPSNAFFVTQVYADLLQRPPDASGFATFAGLLDRGQMNRSQVVQAVESSPEYHTLVVIGLYQSLLRRAVDPVGLTGWTRFLDQGGTQDDLRAQILGSAEYFQRRGGGTNEGFLRALYSDVLGRAPDPNGLRGWSNRLEDASRTEVAGDVIDSREAAILDVVALYGRFLHRNPDAIGFNASVTALQDGVLQEALIATIVGSDEFFNAA